MRRLRSVPVALALALAVVLLGSMSSFSADFAERAAQQGQQVWYQSVLQLMLVLAATSPLMVAVLASRQVDLEHQGGGWILCGSMARGITRLLAAKWAALAVVIGLVTAVEVGAVVLVNRLGGNASPVPIGMFVSLGGCVASISLALTSLHLWLAARIENQLVGLGIGVLGCFVAVFCALVPPRLAAVLPWGYYALSSPVSMTGVRSSLLPVRPPYVVIAAFCVVVVVLAMLLTRRLERRGL